MDGPFKKKKKKKTLTDWGWVSSTCRGVTNLSLSQELKEVEGNFNIFFFQMEQLTSNPEYLLGKKGLIQRLHRR